MIKKYSKFINEEVGMRNLKSITSQYKECEIYFHKDLDGITSALAIKEFFKTYYKIDCIDCHQIQYGGLEYAVKNSKPGVMVLLVDFAHSKPMFTIATDHHDKQSGAKDTESTYFKSARSNVETISGEISYGEIFTQQDIELIKTVDSANFLIHNLKPEDIQNSIFKYKKEFSPEKNRFMMGFVVNRLLLAYKNKRITVTSLDGKRDHINKNVLECLVMDSSASLYSIFNNIRHYINYAKVSDRAGKLASPEEISKNLSDYIERMKNYKFIENEEGESIEFDPKNKQHEWKVKNGAKISKGVHLDKEYSIISQYGGGSMIKPGSYDRYVPFKNNPDANFICIVWPMGLIQVSCNPFKEKKLKNINLGEISKEVLAKHRDLLSNFYVTLLDVKKEYESSQDWKKMEKEEGSGYEGVGFKFSDLEAFYDDCIVKKVGKENVECDIFTEEGIEKDMNTLYQNMNDPQKENLKKYRVSVWELVTRNSGGHPSITNISGLQFMKYNKEMLKVTYDTEKYTDVLKRIARDFINALKGKIDASKEGKEIEYDTNGVELRGQDTNE
jgi:lipoate-protein ligase A